MEHDIQFLYKITVAFLYSFCITLWSIPYVVDKLVKYKYVVQDMYKRGKRMVPTLGGITMLVGILVSLALTQVLLAKEDIGNLFIFYFIVIVYALYGVIDDLFSFRKRYDKIVALFVLTLPIASLIKDTELNLIFTRIEVGMLYSLLIVPMYVMVVANMINLHAGYNGLTQGLSLLLLITIGIKSYLMHGLDNILYLLPVMGAVMAFLPSTLYPAKILPGNVGDLMIGAAIGGLLVVNNLLWFGIVILIPHILNFILDTYTILIRKHKDVKFGKLRDDETIEPPPTMRLKSLKFLIVSIFRLTENQATLALFGLTLFFCVLGLFLF